MKRRVSKKQAALAVVDPVQRALKREVGRIARFLRESSKFWHRESARLLTPQAIPTPKSREAAARAMVLQDAAENIEKKVYLEIPLDE
jgi:hypothetical protein